MPIRAIHWLRLLAALGIYRYSTPQVVECRLSLINRSLCGEDRQAFRFRSGGNCDRCNKQGDIQVGGFYLVQGYNFLVTLNEN